MVWTWVWLFGGDQVSPTRIIKVTMLTRNRTGWRTPTWVILWYDMFSTGRRKRKRFAQLVKSPRTALVSSTLFASRSSFNFENLYVSPSFFSVFWTTVKREKKLRATFKKRTT